MKYFVEILMAKNHDLDNIVTPVKVDILEKLMKMNNYDDGKTRFLMDGFRNGFSLKYRGEANVKRLTENLKLRVGSKLELWNKVMVEVQAGQICRSI